MKRIFISIFCLLSLCPIWAQTASRVYTDSIYSETLQAYRRYTVVLPKSYATDSLRKYPILYLLHGLGGGNEDWVQKGRAVETMDRLACSIPEMILLTPDAGGDPKRCQNGYFNVKDWAYESFFFDELLPFVEQQYRVEQGKASRAIAGLSMGGGGTLVYALKHPELFSSAYAMSALVQVPESLIDRSLDPNSKYARFGLSAMREDPVARLKTMGKAERDQLRSLAWFLDCGDDDYLLDGNLLFYQTMRDLKIPCELRVRDGAHKWSYWQEALQSCLPFAGAHFSKTNTSSCCSCAKTKACCSSKKCKEK